MQSKRNNALTNIAKRYEGAIKGLSIFGFLSSKPGGGGGGGGGGGAKVVSVRVSSKGTVSIQFSYSIKCMNEIFTFSIEYQ